MGRVTSYWVAVLVAVSLGMPNCTRKSWKEVPSLATAHGSLNAGRQVRLIPISSNPRRISTKQAVEKRFKFRGTLVSPPQHREVKGKVTLVGERLIGKKGRTSVNQTWENPPLKWAQREYEREIEIRFLVMPGRTYKGSGWMYFYLTDLEDECVSNIIAWPVVLK